MDTQEHNVGYLCVSEQGEWIPIACSEIKQNKEALFQNMGRNIMYLPAIYENRHMIAAGKPFYLDEKGDVHYIYTDKTEKTISIYQPNILTTLILQHMLLN